MYNNDHHAYISHRMTNNSTIVTHLIRTDTFYLNHGGTVLELLLTTRTKRILRGHATAVVTVERQGGAVGGFADAFGYA